MGKIKVVAKRAKKKLFDPVFKLKKPSELIRLGLHDLEEVEAKPEAYKIDMMDWHRPNGKCSVCFAGAVMAMTYHTDPKKYLMPSSRDMKGVNQKSISRLASLNAARTGAIATFVCRFFGGGGDHAEAMAKKTREALHPEQHYVEVLHTPRNKRERGKFKKQMADIATKLEAIGL